jgi:hypothetical protein
MNSLLNFKLFVHITPKYLGYVGEYLAINLLNILEDM